MKHFISIILLVILFFILIVAIIKIIKKFCIYIYGIHENERKSTYLYDNPIGSIDKDYIGVNEYVSALDKSIKNNNRFIGLISEYGAGKSSVISLLKNKYEERYKIREIIVKYFTTNQTFTNTILSICKNIDHKLVNKKIKLVKINLWNSNYKDGDKVREENAICELHKSFLYQLSDNIGRYNKNYINQKLNSNYNFFKISVPQKASLFWLFGLTFCYIFYMIDKNLNVFFTPVIESLNFDVYGISSNVIFKILFIGAFIICLFKVFVSEILVSFINKERKVKDSYESIVTEIYNQIIESANKKYKKIVIVIEDFDRINNEIAIKRFLKEMYKYYSEINSNNVSFIIAIKPESLLTENVFEQRNKENIYDKIFDYVVEIPKVNSYDFDIILKKMIEETRVIDDKIGKMLTLENLSKLEKGKNLTIRNLKHRYNNTILLFQSLKVKFGLNHNTNIKSCAMVSYLKDEYNQIYYTIINDEIFMSKLIYKLLQNKNIKDNELIELIINKYIENDDFNNLVGSNEIIENDINILLENLIFDLKFFVEENTLKDDYSIYFYNYPKGGNVRNIYEDNLYNCIIMDNSDDIDLYILEFNENKTENMKYIDDIIVSALTSHFNLYNKYPKIIFNNELLFNISLKNSIDILLKSFEHYCSWEEGTYNFSLDLLKNINEFNIDDKYIFYVRLSKLISKELSNNKIINEIRESIVKIFNNNMYYFKELFFNGYPKITRKEILELKNLELVIKLLNTQLINEKDIIYLLEISNNKIENIKLIDNLISEIGLLDTDVYEDYKTVIECLINIMMVHRKLNKKYIQYIIEINDNKEKIDKQSIIKLFNSIDNQNINEDNVDNIIYFDIDYGLNENVIIKLLEYRKTLYYILNMYDFDINKIDFENDKIKENIVSDMKKIYNDINDNIFFDIRLALLKKDMDSVENYIRLFYEFEIINENELKVIKTVPRLLKYLDEKQLTIYNTSLYTDFINTNLKIEDKNNLLEYIKNINDQEIRNLFINNISWTSFGFNKAQKKTIADTLFYMWNLNTDECYRAIELMDMLKYLSIKFEKMILREYLKKKNNNDSSFELYDKYKNLLNNLKYITHASIDFIKGVSYYTPLCDEITDILYRRGNLYQYVYCKYAYYKKFFIESNKLEYLKNYYIKNFKEISTISNRIIDYDFIKLMYNNDVFVDKSLSDEKLLQFARVKQSKKLLNIVLSKDNDFIKKYLSKVNDLSDLDDESINLLRSFFSKDDNNICKNIDRNLESHIISILPNKSSKLSIGNIIRNRR